MYRLVKYVYELGYNNGVKDAERKRRKYQRKKAVSQEIGSIDTAVSDKEMEAMRKDLHLED